MNTFQEGYKFFSNNYAGMQGAQLSLARVNQLEQSISHAKEILMETTKQRLNSTDASLKGFIAEDFHASTFNIDVISKGGKKVYAKVNKANHPTQDINIYYGKKVDSYQVKYYKNAEATARALSNPKYSQVNKIGPADQIEGIQRYTLKKILRSKHVYKEKLAEYEHTNKNISGVLKKGKYQGKPLSEEQCMQLVKDLKAGKMDPAKYGLVVRDFTSFKYIMKNAVKAGVTTAIITAAIQLAPEIVKTISALVAQGEMSVEMIKEVGLTGITASAQGFLSGSLIGGIVEACKTGLLGEGLKKIDPTGISAITIIVMGFIDNGIKLVTKKIDKYEFIDRCLKHVFITACSISLGAASQYFIPIPILGFLLGSLVGAIVGEVVYEGTKKLCLAFCIQTGFTFFGTIDQNYKLPESVLKQLGVKIVEFNRVKFDESKYNKVQYNRVNYNRNKYNTVEIVKIRRGVIGVNRIGYLVN